MGATSSTGARPQSILYFLKLWRTRIVTNGQQGVTKTIYEHGSVHALHLNSQDAPQLLVEGCYRPDGIALNETEMYWTQMGEPGKHDGSVHCARWDGRDHRVLLSGQMHTPKQLCLDKTSQKLYICDREGLRVHRVNTDGSNHEVLVQLGNWRDESQQNDRSLWCVGVTVSSKLKKFFWTQKGWPKSDNGRIFSANIDLPPGETASNRSDIEVVLDHLPEPIDLDILDNQGYLYWTDRGEIPRGNTLNRMLLSGVPSASHEILAHGFGEAVGLCIDEIRDCVWVTDLCGRIWKCDLQRPSKKIKVYEDDEAPLTGVALLQRGF